MSDPVAIGDRYLLDRLLGSGGMGAVYGATDAHTGEVVAVKLMTLGGHEADDRAKARFLREARTLQALRHPAIVRYIDHGVHGDDQPFLVMEWLPGRSLRAILDERGLTPAEALVVAGRVAAALALLAREGIVHRDLKPSNLVLVRDRAALATVVDFGIARGETTTLTQTGHLVGTPFYMSPEQVHTPRKVDARADVFALGAILYECATGQLPFPAHDLVSFIARLGAGDAVPLTAARPELPPAFAALVGRMLIRRREERLCAGPELDAAIDAVRADVDALTELPAVPAAHRDWHAWTDHQIAPGVGPTLTARSTAAAAPQPRARPPIYGRERELAEARRALASPGAGLTIWGLAGVGKSHLAQELAQAWVAEQPAVRAQLSLDFQDVVGADEALHVLCARLGAQSPRAPTRAALLVRLGRVLRARGEPVVVIDGAEMAPSIVAEIVAGWRGPEVGARFLLTARTRLPIRGLAELELGPLRWRVASDAGLAPAVALLLARVGVGDRTPSEDELSAATHVASALEGNPLALELVADRLRTVGLGEHAGTMSLLELLGGVDERSTHPLIDALRGAWDRLETHERRALAECTVFVGGFTARAAEATLTRDARGSILEILGRLRDAALIASEADDDGTVRLRIPRTVREFAAPRLRELGADAACRRRNAFFIEYCGGLAEAYDRSGATKHLVRLAAEVENLLAVVKDTLGRADDDTSALSALLAYDPVIAMRGPIEPQLALLDRALAVTAPGSALLARGLKARAHYLCQLGRFDEGSAELRRALSVADRADARELRASLLLDLGILSHYAQRFDDARRCYEQALIDERATSHPRVEARALSNLAALDHDQGSLDAAADRYEDALAVLESIGDDRQTAQTLTNSALLIQERGDLALARTRYEAAIDRLAQLDDARVRGISLSNLGMLELEQGHALAAVERHREGQQLLAHAGDERSEALCLARLGAAYAVADELRSAVVAFRRAERSSAQLDAPARDTVRLFHAFLDLARARQAARDGRDVAAVQLRQAARARIEEAERPRAGGAAPLRAHSDDARTALRILARDPYGARGEAVDSAVSRARVD